MSNQANQDYPQPSPEQGPNEQTATTPTAGADAAQTTMSILEAAMLHRESVRQSFEEQKATLNKIIKEQKISATQPLGNLRSSMLTTGLAAQRAVPSPEVTPAQETVAQETVAQEDSPRQQSIAEQQPILPQPPLVAPDPTWAATEKLVTSLYKFIVMQLDTSKQAEVAEEAAVMQQFVDGLKLFIAQEVHAQLHAQLQAMNE